ncbi:MAG: hypothetical protein WAP74_02190 [Patescibacteria group bacterium]
MLDESKQVPEKEIQRAEQELREKKLLAEFEQKLDNRLLLRYGPREYITKEGGGNFFKPGDRIRLADAGSDPESNLPIYAITNLTTGERTLSTWNLPADRPPLKDTFTPDYEAIAKQAGFVNLKEATQLACEAGYSHTATRDPRLLQLSREIILQLFKQGENDFLKEWQERLTEVKSERPNLEAFLVSRKNNPPAVVFLEIPSEGKVDWSKLSGEAMGKFPDAQHGQPLDRPKDIDITRRLPFERT